MCNAWNHPPGCTCGWGGEGHAGRSPGGTGRAFGDILDRGVPRTTADHATYWYAPPSIRESYCVPNAHCPVCGATVFFYQSTSGGRVFFDELGPPWPKHPCTDNSVRRYYEQDVRPNRTQTAPVRRFSWEKEGWEPVQFVRLARTSNADVTHVSGASMIGTVDCYITHGHLDAQAPWLMRRTATAEIELSTLVTSQMRGNSVTPEVFSTFRTFNLAAAYVQNRRRSSMKAHGTLVTRGADVRVREARQQSEVAQELITQWQRKYDGLRHNRPLWRGVVAELAMEYSHLSIELIEQVLALHTDTATYRDRFAKTSRRYNLGGRRIDEPSWLRVLFSQISGVCTKTPASSAKGVRYAQLHSIIEQALRK